MQNIAVYYVAAGNLNSIVPPEFGFLRSYIPRLIKPERQLLGILGLLFLRSVSYLSICLQSFTHQRCVSVGLSGAGRGGFPVTPQSPKGVPKTRVTDPVQFLPDPDST